jgi:hypothetical protein
MKLSNVHEYILHALIDGATLKAHRYLDGAKLYKLHPLDGPAEPVERETVDHLKQQGLIKSNMKFPAATYLLTEKGKEVAISVADPERMPLSVGTTSQDVPTYTEISLKPKLFPTQRYWLRQAQPTLPDTKCVEGNTDFGRGS